MGNSGFPLQGTSVVEPMSPEEAITVHLRDPKLHGVLAALVEVAAVSPMLDHVGSRITAIFDGIAVTVEREGFPGDVCQDHDLPCDDNGDCVIERETSELKTDG